MYKLITMDHAMPKIDGPTATRAIRELVEEFGSSIGSDGQDQQP